MSVRKYWLTIMAAMLWVLVGGSFGCNSDAIWEVSDSAFATTAPVTTAPPPTSSSTSSTSLGTTESPTGGSGESGTSTGLGTTGTLSSTGELCQEGTENCPCFEDLCFSGLACDNGTCVRGGSTTGTGTTGEMTGTTGEPWQPCSLITCYDIFAGVNLMGEEPCFVYKGMALQDQQAVNALVWWAEKFGYTHAFDPSLDPIGSQLYNFTFLTDQERWAVEFLEFRGIDLTHLSDDFTDFACMEKILPLRDEIWGAKPYWTVLDPSSPWGINYNEGYGQVLKLGFAAYPNHEVPLQELTVTVEVLNGNNPVTDCELFVTLAGQKPKPVTTQGLQPGKNTLSGFQIELEGYVEIELLCDPSMAAYTTNFKVWPADDAISAELRLHGELTESVNIYVYGG